MTHPRLSRRDFLAVAGLATTGAALGACGGGAGADQAPGLSYWTLLDPRGEDPRGPAERRIFDIFEDEGGPSVREEVIPWQDIDPNVLAAVQAGNPPEVTRTNYYNFQTHVYARSLTSLQDVVDRDLAPEELDDFVVSLEGEDGISAFLTENVGNALFLRRDWLDESGLDAPATWEEFIEVATVFSRSHDGAAGFLTFGDTSESGQVAYLFQPMIHGRGGRILDDEGFATFHSEAGIETLEFLRSLVVDHGVMPANAATMAYAEQIDAFLAGRVGMIIEGSHRYARARESLGAENLEVVRIPGPDASAPSPCSVTGWAMAIPEGSADPEAAWDLIRHRIDPDMQEIWGEMAFGIPSRRSVLDRPYFQSEEAEIIRWWFDYMETDGALTVAPRADAQLNRILAEAFQQVILDPSSSIPEVLHHAADRFNASA